MSTTGTVIHYTERGCQYPNPHEIQCCKLEFAFGLCSALLEHSRGIK